MHSPLFTVVMEQELDKFICIRGLISCYVASGESSLKLELKTHMRRNS